MRDCEKHIERILDIIDKVEIGKLTILTGSNGSGKSLIRKQLCFKLANKVPDSDYRTITADVSMQRRTESSMNLGAMGNFMHDDPWNPTSLSTFQFIETLFNTFNKNDEHKRYLIIDEPEIGMSKESQLGFINWFKKQIPSLLENTLGVMLITHSELIVEQLKELAIFLNIDKDCTADEWINREIIPTDFEKLAEESHELYLAVLNNGKNK